MSDFNKSIIAEFRDNEGKVGGTFAGETLLLLHTTGAHSGKAYVTPLICLPDGERQLIFASNAGGDTHPAWYHNLKANPDTTIEIGVEKVQVRATEAQGDERDRLWGRLVEHNPVFGEYQKKTSRVIPVFVLEPVR
ncbi:nitroreductase family deazaflavin-dependent oxidoreductase [Amycolatopsis sp. RM579]|uniref:Nitroreductase family deazaflavin-dependent oxidoreductase n=2 Tax=Amycolatopsis pithecellobii TaxID=664692 RepID=A0A6N7YSR3_9PSEU|nr:nitroreductase family deazaflavin-dependent oxidoreductase [Amycolatopsis pithecellobii]